MKKDKSAREELEELSPLLARMHAKEISGEAPQDFFKHLPNEVFRRIKLEDQHAAVEHVVEQPNWWSWLFPARQPRLAWAFATLLLIAVAAVFTLWPGEQGKTNMASTELSAEDWEAYVSQNIDEFDSELLWQATQTSTELPEITNDESDEIIDDLLEDLSEDDLEEFFM